MNPTIHCYEEHQEPFDEDGNEGEHWSDDLGDHDCIEALSWSGKPITEHSIIAEAARFLFDSDATQASSSHFRPGMWYSTSWDEHPYTGEQTQKTFHLKGFSPEMERAVCESLASRIRHRYGRKLDMG
jgi:hypothetical protein